MSVTFLINAKYINGKITYEGKVKKYFINISAAVNHAIEHNMTIWNVK